MFAFNASYSGAWMPNTGEYRNIYKNKAGTFSYCWFRDKTSLATGTIALDPAKEGGVYYNRSMLTTLALDKDGNICLASDAMCQNRCHTLYTRR